MCDPYFYCYRCKQHKRNDLISTHVSPSGRPCCISCTDKLQKGVTISKAAKKMKPANAEWLASVYR